MKRMTKGLCALLAAVLIAGAIPAAAVNVTETCSLTVKLADKLEETNHGELMKTPFTVSLYRVADINATYDYAPVDAFANLELTGYKDIKEAKEMEAIVQSAVEMSAAADVTREETTGTTGEVTFTGLATGLYLVMVDETPSYEHVYSFAPVLVSLPTMEGGEMDENGEMIPGTWSGADDYDVELTLKPETDPVYGGLTIEKTLSSFHTSGGPATFLFQIEATMPNPSDVTNPTKTVYSNVVTMVFDAAGAQRYTINPDEQLLPLGATVTVTEVYSGAGYTLTAGDPAQSFKLGWQLDGDGNVVTDGNNWLEAGSVSFTNNYNGSLVTGSAVENQFSRNGESWDWNPVYTGAQTAQ